MDQASADGAAPRNCVHGAQAAAARSAARPKRQRCDGAGARGAQRPRLAEAPCWQGARGRRLRWRAGSAPMPGRRLGGAIGHISAVKRRCFALRSALGRSRRSALRRSSAQSSVSVPPCPRRPRMAAREEGRRGKARRQPAASRQQAGYRRVPCRKARLQCGRGEVCGTRFETCRERRAPGLQASSAGRSVIIYMRFVRCFADPHDNPPSLAGEGDSIPQHKSKHTSGAHGDEARKAQGGGKRNLHLVFRGRWISTRGPSHTPFGGVRQLARTYRQCGANRAPPDNLYSHTGQNEAEGEKGQCVQETDEGTNPNQNKHKQTQEER
eukprot:scaffold19389_cov112-Isochrysis_galbana.AAC.3